MLFGTRSKILLVALFIGASFILSGCMFYGKMADGRVMQLNVSSLEIFRFMQKFDTLSGAMIKEANYRGEKVLASSISQMRSMAFQLRRQSFASHKTAVDLKMLERKFNAFDKQILDRIHSNPNAPGAQAIYSLHYQLKKEVKRFKTLVENSVH